MNTRRARYTLALAREARSLALAHVGLGVRATLAALAAMAASSAVTALVLKGTTPDE